MKRNSSVMDKIGVEVDDLHCALSSAAPDNINYSNGVYFVFPARYSGPGPSIPRSLQNRLREMTQSEFQSYTRTNLKIEELDFLMRSDEYYRQKSFDASCWPHENSAFTNTNMMLAAGFYRFGKYDAVRCPFCCKVIENWIGDQTPEIEHASAKSDCVVIKRRSSSNNLQNQTLRNVTFFTAFGNYHMPMAGANLELKTYEGFKYMKLETRLTSYPKVLQETHQMSMNEACENGFFYVEIMNLVRCHSCGLSFALPDNESRSQICIMHASWSPDCKFLRKQKGSLLIEEVRRATPEHKRTVTPIDRMSESSGVSSHFAQFPDLVVQSRRFETFRVPYFDEMSLEALQMFSSAGFFNDGGVQCFYCGVSVELISQTVDPWKYHALNSADCSYLIQMRGNSYIESVIQSEETDKIGAENKVTKWSTESENSDTEQSSNQPTVENLSGDGKQCELCAEDKLEMVLIAFCGHVICEACLRRLENQQCPFCRQKVHYVVPIKVLSSVPMMTENCLQQPTQLQSDTISKLGDKVEGEDIRVINDYDRNQGRCKTLATGAEHNHYASDNQERLGRSRELSASSSELGISTKRATHTEYAVAQARLRTYNRWPDSNALTKEELCEAGFYYTGFDDQVWCFSCSIGIREWSVTDNPWEEHARWYPDCAFLLQQKGQDYVDEVRERTPASKMGVQRTRAQARREAAKIETRSDQERMYEVCHDLGYGNDLMAAAIHHHGVPFENVKELIEVIANIENGELVVTDRYNHSGREEVQRPREAAAVEPARRERTTHYKQGCKHCEQRTGRYKPADHVSLPCGHLSICESCNAEELAKMDRGAGAYTPRCVTCKALLTGTIKAFLG